MSSPEFAPINPKIGLIYTAADLISPIFLKAAMGDAPLAARMAVEGIEDYRPRTRADYVNLARTIAFSMASLLLLGHAASAETTMPEKMRAFGRANALTRSADQSERTMMLRRRDQQANPDAEPANREPAPASSGAPSPDTTSPDSQFSDTEMQASIADAMKEYLASQKTPATSALQPASDTEPAVARALQAPAGAPATAIHGNRQPKTATPSYRAQLLHGSAMQRGASADGIPHQLQPAVPARTG